MAALLNSEGGANGRILYAERLLYIKIEGGLHSLEQEILPKQVFLLTRILGARLRVLLPLSMLMGSLEGGSHIISI